MEDLKEFYRIVREIEKDWAKIEEQINKSKGLYYRNPERYI